MPEPSNYSSDSPLSNPEKDRFSRWSFAKRISEVIAKRTDPSSLIIGLYGAWGDGKTTVLNFIERAFEDSPNVICLKFNPWRYGSEEQLLEGFFQDIADVLDTKLITSGEKVKDIFKKAAPAATGIFGQSAVGGGVAQFINGPTLNELRDRIEKVLKIAKRRIVILADDIDRLEKEEIHATFRLVKLTADFKYTSYILAFDEQVVSAALQDRYGIGTENAGKAFLEKIIQVPLNLPSVDKKIIRTFCFEGVDNALSIAEIKLTDEQVQEFVRDFSLAFDRRIKTPRKAKLYGNILMFSLPILKGETNPVDLMLIEGIRIFYPILYDIIKQNKTIFTGSSPKRLSDSFEKEKPQIISMIEKSIDSSDREEIDGVLHLLKSMFPKLEAVYGNTHYGSDWGKNWREAQRICSPEYFQRYFSYAIPTDDIPDRIINKIIDTSSKCDFENANRLFKQLLTTQNAERIIQKLRSRAKTLDTQASINLANLLIKYPDQYPNPENLFDWSNPLVQAAMLISDLIQNIVDKNEKKSVSINCINNTPELSFSLEIFGWLRREKEDKPETDGFNLEEITDIGSELGKRIKIFLDSNEDITIEYPKICGALLYQVKKFINDSEVKKYLENLFKKNKKSVFRFIDTFTPTVWGVESGISHKSDFKREQYDSIVNLVDPDTLISAIKNEIGTLPDIEEDYPRDDKNREMILTKQFLWIHNYVQNEKSHSADGEVK